MTLGTGAKYPGKDHDFSRVDPAVWSAIVNCATTGDRWPLVLTGDVGSGKTCAALSLLDFVQGGRKFMTVAQMCEELIGVQNGQREYGGKPDTLPAWWARWREAKCIVLDELAARDKVSDFQYESVKRAIDEREERPSVFISNLPLDVLSRVYDNRIASRLAGGTVIHFKGADRRLA